MEAISPMPFDRITVDAKVMNGQPCIRAMRLTVKRVVSLAAQGLDREALHADYPELGDEDIRQALEYNLGAARPPQGSSIRGELDMAQAQVLDYEGAVKEIAKGHRRSGQPPRAVVLFRDPEEQVIRILDVTDLVAETGEVYRFRFGPTFEMPYITEIAQVTPSEWQRILNREIDLPEGWDLNTREEI
jgi:uncharacterized protein (DUF433 family)